MSDGTSWYVSTCKDCLNYDLTRENPYRRGEYYCKERREYYPPTERACSNRFDNNYEKNPGTPSACYLTTIVSNILGFEDQGPILTTLRSFRDSFMKENLLLRPLLYEYDMIGPKIAMEIWESPKRVEFAQYLYTTYILPTVKKIQEKNYQQAIVIYCTMVKQLRDVFSISNIQYDPTLQETGKGYFKVRDSQY